VANCHRRKRRDLLCITKSGEDPASDGFIEFTLPAARDENLRPFRNEALRSGQSDTAVAPDDDGDSP